MKTITEADAWVWYKNTCSTRITPFQEFKDNLVKNGYTFPPFNPRTQPDKSAVVPRYDFLTEGFDPDKLPK